MRLVFVHGWSVTDTDTYGGLPEALAARAGDRGLDLDISHVWLGRYISFNDAVSMHDVVRAFDRALRDTIPADGGGIQTFSCITHSTGGPVVREWLDAYFGAKGLSGCPLRHLVMLAPANHGSPLAALGKGRVGRIKAWWNGIEPGQRILNWLCLGSPEQESLCERYLDYNPVRDGVFPFVLSGQTIDRKFYDFLNSYLVEKGSDGVVRVAGANLNYGMVTLVQDVGPPRTVRHALDQVDLAPLRVEPRKGRMVARPRAVAFGVIPDASHSGDDIGIMRSVTPASADAKPVVASILDCLSVADADGYQSLGKQLAARTREVQRADKESDRHAFTQLVFGIRDHVGNPVNDFDLILLAGPEGRPENLPSGFFVDRQRNGNTPNRLVYYVDHNKLKRVEGGVLGFRVFGRPSDGMALYKPAEFLTSGMTLGNILKANETLYVDIVLHRFVDREVFRFDPGGGARWSFKDVPPSGTYVDEP